MTFKLQAICKGDTLKLERAIDVPQGTPVSVMVFTDDEREEWLRAGDAHFATAYGSDEPEYSFDDLIKE